ncbi:type ISP restriction/modification enzyme, partial [Treponema endosymbiont of Eucomonympha sp.]|uniref:type ISP restriction/modification enzyme n=1 Tax=Treponema endosymbiont of Eucomonympha sp. TaxID=1580831 RepID=UPI000750A65C
IPQSNPFLQKFFQHIAGYDLDDRIRWIVDALADLFNCVAVEDLLKEFGRARQDPYIHFYETFLAEYDPVMRKGRGVWYTPLPVVRFIVGAADDILKTEFNLPEGLADKSKVALPIPQDGGKPKDCEFHRVQILDPATGTGTFLAAVIDKVYEKFANQQGMWAGYCAEHLIPRLNGFEILMASYAMAHFKLDMKLKETGCRNSAERLRVFLTNSLDSAPLQTAELPFAQWLATESAEARRIKRDVPIMVMLANPPYNVSTQNKNEWIDSLIDIYKTGLHEKKLNLDDDYIKFIRYGQYYIDKNKNGIEAYISNNSFIDGVTHRQMRKSLLQSFDKIYILNLHGSAKKKECAPDGGKDENVFDIQQGVSINIFIKTGSKKEGDFATVYYRDLYGKRENKYSFLLENKIDSIGWKKLDFNKPYYFFTPKNFSGKREYEIGFSITELFAVYNSGIKTDRDSLFIDFDKTVLAKRMKKLLSGNFDNDFRELFNVKDSGSYKLTEVIKNKAFKEENIRPLLYRPFDTRYIYYEQGITSRPAFDVMKNIYTSSNVSLLTSRCIPPNQGFDRAFATSFIADIHSASDQTYVFPLYLYPEKDTLDAGEKRRPNLSQAIIDELSARTGLRYTAEKEDTPDTFAPLDALDYVYAVLHSPAYREKYREFLKIDFPCVPYPADAAQFRALCRLGARLRTLHLLDGAKRGELAAYPIDDTHRVEKTEYRNGKVWINQTQYFDAVPQGVWDFYVGGYQPAQKWLKDRKRRELCFDDIEHYQQIVAALQETIALQGEIDAARGVRR